MAVLARASTGACMVFPGEAFDLVATMSAGTALHDVQTMFIALLMELISLACEPASWRITKFRATSASSPRCR